MSMIIGLVEKLRNLADYEYAFADTDTMEVLNEAADVIEELSAKLQAVNMERSSQYYNGGWIPVSERLPEETGWYIVTFRVYGGGYAVCELSYRKPENYWTDKDIFKKALSNDEILAWMPLPERYKDGE